MSAPRASPAFPLRFWALFIPHLIGAPIVLLTVVTFLHELAHAAVALALGGTITEFSFLPSQGHLGHIQWKPAPGTGSGADLLVSLAPYLMWSIFAAATMVVAGVYLVVGTGAEFGGSSLAGDLFTLGAVCCWAVYTVGSRSLLARYSPLAVTGITMLAGTALYVPASAGQLAQLDWARVPAWAWAAMALSALLALNVAYLIWYTSVQRIGNVRTSAYSNFIPLVAMAVAAATLGDPIGVSKLAGAGAILAGVAITRVAARRRAAPDPPAEE